MIMQLINIIIRNKYFVEEEEEEEEIDMELKFGIGRLIQYYQKVLLEKIGLNKASLKNQAPCFQVE